VVGAVTAAVADLQRVSAEEAKRCGREIEILSPVHSRWNFNGDFEGNRESVHGIVVEQEVEFEIDAVLATPPKILRHRSLK
jgi:hypothetical protein